ncbi:MAG: ABC transporter permease, partial [Balneolaceae bacterium]
MNWRQIRLVLQREYLTRVRTKVFVISTLLIPLGLIAYIGLIIGIQFWQSEPEQQIGIHDQNEVLAQRLVQLNPDRYLDKSDVPADTLRMMVMRHELDGYIVLEEHHISGQSSPEYIYRGSSSITLQGSIRSDLREVIREELLARAGVSDEVRSIFQSRIDLESRKLTEEGGEEEDQTAFYTGLGFVMGFIIFFALFMYGTIIMKGVIEEKTSRIVEVIASSVKPIELLTGKILGITCVALTQFLAWFILTALIVAAASPIMAMVMSSQPVDPGMVNEAVETMD